MGIKKYAAKNDAFKNINVSIKQMKADLAQTQGFNLVRELNKNSRGFMQKIKNPTSLSSPQSVSLKRRFSTMPIVNDLGRSINKVFTDISRGNIWKEAEDDIFSSSDFDYGMFSEYDDFDLDNMDDWIFSDNDYSEEKSNKKIKRKSSKSSDSGGSSNALDIAKASGNLYLSGTKALATSVNSMMQTYHVEKVQLALKQHGELMTEVRTINQVNAKILNILQEDTKKYQNTMVDTMKAIYDKITELSTDIKTAHGISKTGEMNVEYGSQYQSTAALLASGQFSKGFIGGITKSMNLAGGRGGAGGNMLSTLMQFAPMAPLFLNTKSITKGALGVGGRAVLGDKKYSGIEEFFTNPAKFVGRMLSGLAYSDNPIISTIFAGFGDKRGKAVANKISQRSSTKYDDPTQWTNADSDALKVVIPTLLSQILAANSGREEKAYDYRSRTFKTRSQANKEIKRQDPLNMFEIEDIVRDQISLYEENRDKGIKSKYDKTLSRNKQQTIELLQTVMLQATVEGVPVETFLGGKSPKNVAKALGIDDTESIEVVMDFMKTLNDKGGEKGRKTVDRLNQSIEGYRDRVFSANAMTEENNRIGAYASFGSESVADIYIPTDDYRKWYDYQTLLKKTDSQIQQEKKKILRMGGIFKLTEKQQKDYINKKKKEYESEYGNIDNESYASAYRGGSGSSGSSRSIKSSTGTETRTDDFFDTIYGKPNKKIKLSIDPEERKNAKIEKYVKSKRGFDHDVASTIAEVLTGIHNKTGSLKAEQVAAVFDKYGGSKDFKNYKVTDEELAEFDNKNANRTSFDTTDLSTMKETGGKMIKEMYGDRKGGQGLKLASGAAMGGVMGLLLNKAMGMKSPFLLPLAAAVTGAGFGFANKFNNMSDVLFGEKGDEIMGNDKSKRANLLSNMVTNMLPSAVMGSFIGKKVNSITKAYVPYGPILGPILGAVTGVGATFAFSQMDLIRKALKGLGIGKLLGKTKIGGKIAGFLGIGEDSVNFSNKEITGENTGSIMDNSIDNTGLKRKDDDEEPKEGKGLLLTGALLYGGYKMIQKLVQTRFKNKLKSGKGLDVAGCALAAAGYAISNLLQDNTIKITDFMNVANKHLGVMGGVRYEFFKEIGDRYRIPYSIYEKRTHYSLRKLKKDLDAGSQIIVLADLVDGSPHYVVGSKGSGSTVVLFDPMAGESRSKEDEISPTTLFAMGQIFIVFKKPKKGMFGLGRPIYESDGEDDPTQYGRTNESVQRAMGQEGMGPGDGSPRSESSFGNTKAKYGGALGMMINPFNRVKPIIQAMVHFLTPMTYFLEYIRDIQIKAHGDIDKKPEIREFTLARKWGIISKIKGLASAINPLKPLKALYDGTIGHVFGIIKDVSSTLKTGFGSLVKGFTGAFGWLMDKTHLGDLVKGAKSFGIGALKLAASPITGVFKNIFGKNGILRDSIIPLFKEVGSAIASGTAAFLKAPGKFLKQGIEKGREGLGFLLNKGKEVLGNAGDIVKGGLTFGVNAIKTGINAGVEATGRLGKGVKGIFEGRGMSGFTKEPEIVKVAGGYLDGVGVIGSTDADLFRSIMKNTESGLGATGSLAGKAKTKMLSGVNSIKSFFRNNSEARSEDMYQDQAKFNELRNTQLLEQIASSGGNAEQGEEKKKPGLLGMMAGGIAGILAWLGLEKYGDPKEYVKGTVNNIVHGGIKLGTKFVQNIAKKFTKNKSARKAGQEMAEKGFKTVFKSVTKEAGEAGTKNAVKNIAKEGVENAAKEGASNPKVIKLLVKTVIDIAQKFAKIAAKLPLIGKFFKKGLGKVLVDAAPNVGKELAEKAAKESAEHAAKNAAKNATKGGLRTVSGVTKDAAGATMGISYLVGVVIDVAFFAYDVQDGWRHAPEDFRVTAEECTMTMRIASGTAGGLLSALVSAVTAIPGMSTTMSIVSMIIVSLIPRAWISTILYSLFRKFFDADRERDYDNDKFEISIIGGTEHEEYKELREKVKNNTADEGESKRYQELHKKLEDAKKDQVSKDKAKEKKEKDEQKAKEQAEKNKGQTAQGNQAKNYMYGQYGVPTYKGSYNGYGMYGVPAGRGEGDTGNSMIGNMMNSVTSSISGLFTSQNIGGIANKQLGTELGKQNGCAVAVAKMIFKFLRKNVTTEELMKLAKRHLQGNATKISFFEELGGHIVNDKDQVTAMLKKKGTAVAILKPGKTSNHFVAIFNDNGKILLGDPERAGIEQTTADGYEVRSMISAAVFNIDGNLPFNMNTLGRATIEKRGFGLFGKGDKEDGHQPVDKNTMKEVEKDDQKKSSAQPNKAKAVGFSRDFKAGYKRSGVNPLEMSNKKSGGVSNNSSGSSGDSGSKEEKKEAAPAENAASGTPTAGNFGGGWDKLLDMVLGFEGKYFNHPNDSGGETMYGITIANARKYGYTGAMKDMPLDTAKGIYRKYFDESKIAGLKDPAMQAAAFDFRVNSGGHAAAKLGEVLQGMGVSGAPTKSTMTFPDALITAANSVPDQKALTKKYIDRRRQFFKDIVARKPNQGVFLKGWLNRVNKVDSMLTGGASNPAAWFVKQSGLINPPNLGIDTRVSGCAIAVAKMVCRSLGNGMTDGKLYEAAKKNIQNGLIHIAFFQVIPGGTISTSASPKQIDDLTKRGEGAIALLTKKNGMNHYVSIIITDKEKLIGDPEGSKFWKYDINNQFVKDAIALAYWKKDKTTTKNVDGYAKGTTQEQIEQIKNGEAVASSTAMSNSEIASAQNAYNAANGGSTSSSGKSGLTVDTIQVKTLTDSTGKVISLPGAAAASAANVGSSGGATNWLAEARKWLNNVKPADVVMFHKEGGQYNADASKAWCASFVSYCLKKGGVNFPGSPSSQYPLAGGKEYFDKIESPKVGAVIVWTDTKRTGGHTAFVTDVSGDKIKWIGGNQTAKAIDDGSVKGKSVTETSDFRDPKTGHGVNGRYLAGFYWPKGGGSTTTQTKDKSEQKTPEETKAADPKNNPKNNANATAGAGGPEGAQEGLAAKLNIQSPDAIKNITGANGSLIPSNRYLDSSGKTSMKRGLETNMSGTNKFKEPAWMKFARGTARVLHETNGLSQDGIRNFVMKETQGFIGNMLAPYMQNQQQQTSQLINGINSLNQNQLATNQTLTNNNGNNMVNSGNTFFESNSSQGGDQNFNSLRDTMLSWSKNLNLDNVKG